MTNCADFDLFGDDDSWILWCWCYYRNDDVVDYDNDYGYVDVNDDQSYVQHISVLGPFLFIISVSDKANVTIVFNHARWL